MTQGLTSQSPGTPYKNWSRFRLQPRLILGCAFLLAYRNINTAAASEKAISPTGLPDKSTSNLEALVRINIAYTNSSKFATPTKANLPRPTLANFAIPTRAKFCKTNAAKIWNCYFAKYVLQVEAVTLCNSLLICFATSELSFSSKSFLFQNFLVFCFVSNIKTFPNFR